MLCAGIGIAITISRFISDLFQAPAAVLAVLQAVLVSALVVPSIVWLRRRKDRQSVTSLGMSWRIGTPVGIGVGVALVSAALVWLPAFAAGWIRFDSLNLGELVIFLIINITVLFLYEALPEELALRGYAWANVASSWSPFAATLIVTGLFSFSAALISVFQTGSAILLNVEAQGLGLAPAGNDPIVYFVQLIVFGLALCAARRIPVMGALTIAIAFHVVQLTITRVLLGGLGWLSAGVEFTFVEPDAIVLVLVHIALSGLIFLVIRIWYTKRLRFRTPRSTPSPG